MKLVHTIGVVRMYKKVFFEISGVCNAKCPWCTTGKQNRDRSIPRPPARFIDVCEFGSAIDRLLSMGLIDGRSTISPYNWGEPALHPNLGEILDVLVERRLRFEISTNASRTIELSRTRIKNLAAVRFSVPGFSQRSYDLIHRLDFHNVLGNIERICRRLRSAHFGGHIDLIYHVYQFNIEEVPRARDFCRTHKIRFKPTIAHFNDFEYMTSYQNGTLDADVLQEASQQLLLSDFTHSVGSGECNDPCPQWGTLNIDEYCNVVLCCMVPKGHPDYSIGNLFDLSAEEIQTGKISKSVCHACKSSGLAYWRRDYKPEILTQLSVEGRTISFAESVRRSVTRKVNAVLTSL